MKSEWMADQRAGVSEVVVVEELVARALIDRLGKPPAA
jgi:hypothetical protein